MVASDIVLITVSTVTSKFSWLLPPHNCHDDNDGNYNDDNDGTDNDGNDDNDNDGKNGCSHALGLLVEITIGPAVSGGQP